MNKRIVGKCGSCGGKVSVPTVFPVPRCESCGAQIDETANLPVLPMLPTRQVTLEPYQEPTTAGSRLWWRRYGGAQ